MREGNHGVPHKHPGGPTPPSRHADCTSRIAEYTSRLSDCTSRIGEYTSRLSDCTSRLAEYTSRHADCTSRLGDCTSRIADYTSRLGDCTSRIADCTSRLGDYSLHIAVEFDRTDTSISLIPHFGGANSTPVGMSAPGCTRLTENAPKAVVQEITTAAANGTYAAPVVAAMPNTVTFVGDRSVIAKKGAAKAKKTKQAKTKKTGNATIVTPASGGGTPPATGH